MNLTKITEAAREAIPQAHDDIKKSCIIPVKIKYELGQIGIRDRQFRYELVVTRIPGTKGG
jgi:hypothetical protein